MKIFFIFFDIVTVLYGSKGYHNVEVLNLGKSKQYKTKRKFEITLIKRGDINGEHKKSKRRVIFFFFFLGGGGGGGGGGEGREDIRGQDNLGLGQKKEQEYKIGKRKNEAIRKLKLLIY